MTGVKPFQNVTDCVPVMALPFTTAAMPLTLTVSVTLWPRPFVMLSITLEPPVSSVAEFTVPNEPSE